MDVAHFIDANSKKRERRGTVNHILNALMHNKRGWSAAFDEVSNPVCISLKRKGTSAADLES